MNVSGETNKPVLRKAGNLKRFLPFFMNIRTLSKEKLDYKTGSLPVALYPEKMIKRKDKESGYSG